MKFPSFILFVFSFSICFSQTPPSGSYISIFSQNNYTVSKDGDKIEIKTCKNLQPGAESLTDNLSYLKLDDGKYYWNGEMNPKLILEYNPTTKVITYKNPYNFNEEFYIYLMQEKGENLSNNVKSYRDETEGGYSSARYLVENSENSSNLDCLIHTTQSNEFNSWVVGSYVENPNGIRATLNSDFTGTLNEHPIIWSNVSTAQGDVINVNNDSVVFLSIMVEYTQSIPFWIDPVPGKKIGQLYSFKAFKNENQIIFGLGAEKQ